MHKLALILAVGAIAVLGCNNNNNGNGQPDMSIGGGGGDGGVGADMTPPLDMVDTTTAPAPTSTHVGATGPSAGLVTAGVTAAAYLLNPTAGTPATGQLHVATAAGVDKVIDTGVSIGGYALSADGKHVIYTKPSGGAGSLFWADASAATVTPKTLFTGNYAAAQLNQGGFMAPSTHFFLAGVKAAGVAASLDLHVIDMSNGNDVYDRLNGGFDYQEVVLPDDTMFFQDTAGGTGTTTPPVQTLYSISLTGVMTTSTASTVTTRTSSFTPTADDKTVVIQKTSGDIYTWNVTAHTLSSAALVTGAAKLTLGGNANGPIAYLGGDGSVHVITTDGMKLLDTAASAMTSVNAPIILAPDGGDVYFFQNGDLSTGGVQNNMGTLMRVAVQSGATPSKVADKVSIRDVQVMDNAILFLQNLAAPPMPPAIQFGDAAVAQRDGTGITALGTKVPVGGLMAVNPGPDTWFAMHLAMSTDDSATHTPIDGSLPALGSLMWADYTGGAEKTLDATVHQGAFGFALDDGRTAAFVTGAAWNATANNYVGSLAFIAARAPSMKVDGMLSGVSELGPIVARSLFVNAPAAATAGVYFVKY
ncbi:MAG TPA: hypothetical protein VHB97_09390 [Polyangia bacterium]|nr:hypothetical protein [Polyangia bacterium]